MNNKNFRKIETEQKFYLQEFDWTCCISKKTDNVNFFLVSCQHCVQCLRYLYMILKK